MRPSYLSHSHPHCAATRDILTIIGSKWAVLVVALLQERPKRFSELKREIGDITQKSLTSVLRELEKNGIVERVVTPTVPPRVDYSLTRLGQSLLGPIGALGLWAAEHHETVLHARARYEAPTAA
ncbi:MULTISPECIES: helix-turn-helix domain-containing protein [unclassified Devosia]|uniref:winged helix-turn-helix transcriptional regulator n=1 Tax=unclassified Devosia TaxID=196773 RepID=UPI000FDB8B20|nr:MULTISPECIES: helix-turn-helix domain-containing protein [unclassified Devosia]